MDARLLDLLVCPICKGPLQFDRAEQELICPRDKLAYPVHDDIPVLLVELARDLEPHDAADTGTPASSETATSEQP